MQSGNPVSLPLAFYVAMELLQYKQYDTLDKCNNENKTLTRLSYVLVWLQPILWNWQFYQMERSEVYRYTMWISVAVFFLAMDRMFTNFLYRSPGSNDELHEIRENASLLDLRLERKGWPGAELDSLFPAHVFRAHLPRRQVPVCQHDDSWSRCSVVFFKGPTRSDVAVVRLLSPLHTQCGNREFDGLGCERACL
mgnify:FL=1